MNIQSPDARLASALQDSLQHGISKTFPQLLVLLSEGQPLPPARIAAALGRSVQEIQTMLQRFPSLEWDETGNVVGAGITLRPTPHQFAVNGRALYTWCALDTLLFPVLLETTAQVTSTCSATGSPIRLIVTPTGVEHLNPADAVVSLVTPPADPDIRAVFCNEVHFFRSRTDATGWLATHPGGSVVPVAEAFQLGRTLAATIATPHTHPPICSAAESCC